MSSLKNHSKKIVFICPYPFNIAPGQRFRYEQYLALLTGAGYHIQIKPFLDERTFKLLYKPGHFLIKIFGILKGFIGRFIHLSAASKADFVFIFREASPIGPPVFEFILSKIFKKKIVYDFDDAIWLPNTSEENKTVSILKWHSKIKAICRWSHVVSCGNTFLCDYARKYNTNVVLNPTTIDTETLHNPDLYAPLKARQKMITIGWTGTHSTLKYLDGILPVIEALEKKLPGQFRFVIIADKRPAFSFPSFDFVAWNKATEIEDLLYFDVGLMPLSDDVWSRGKCGLKALQYMALGIPAVVSSVGVNSSIVDHGVNGYLCRNDEDWETSLTKLITNPDHGHQLGRAAREKILRYFSVESNKGNFLSLFG